MSSIYRKGRDRYFYYQTYVYNDETGKKDKRIFHSLSTKDRSEAKKKQIEYDEKYEKDKNYLENKTSFKVYFFLIVGFFGIVSIILVTSNITYQKKVEKNSIVLEKSNVAEPVDFPHKNHSNTIFKTSELKNIDSNKESSIKNLELLEKNEIYVLPEFNIVRDESLSGAFNQRKFFVTVEKNTNKKSLELVCQKIQKEFSQYSNILICIYTNDLDGHKFAIGKNNELSLEAQKRVWLAMYSFNTVEGHYFDGNPGAYLGAF